MNIPFSITDIREEDLRTVNDILTSGWLIHGEYTLKLESGFCGFTGVPNAITVSNATAGLHLS
ncbi:MAG: DegT/DnrJ/EryC1/StrS family aminotransferase, partial [Ekhidna sp.]